MEYTQPQDAMARRRQLKPLTGISILLVEDSRSVSEAIRMMAIHMGARIRRADCLASAAKHLMIFDPDVLIVDLGLPDGNGIDLAREVVAQGEIRPRVLLLSAADEAVTAAAAASAGADGFMLKPIDRIADLQEAVLGVLGTTGVTFIGDEGPTQLPLGADPVVQDLENAFDLLGEAVEDQNRITLAFCAQFLAGVAATIGDAELGDAAAGLTGELQTGANAADQARATRALVEDRLTIGQARSA